MKLSDIALLASCAVLVLSQPLEKRVLVIETKYEEVVETVEITTTYYITPGGHAPRPSVTPEVVVVSSPVSQKRSATPRRSPIETVASPPPPPRPVVTAEAPPPPPVVKSEPPPPPPVVTSEAPPPPPVVKSEPPPPPPPVVISEAPPPPPVISPAPPVQSPSAAPQEKYEYSYSYSFDDQVAKPSSTVVEAPPPSVTPKVEKLPALAGGSTGGACGEVGGKCVGDLTFYEAGLGACGTYNNGETEAVFALAHGMMGTQSNGNPFCGRTATIKANGKSVVATLVDKCMGCEGQSIDVSFNAIDQIMDRAVGRMHNVEWYFND